MDHRVQADLAELRQIVNRAREQTHELTESIKAARAGLAEERARIQAERLRLETEARHAHRNGQLGHGERALVDRIDRGETTWQAVVNGTDDHWTAEGARRELGEGVEAMVEDLRDNDPEFMREHERALEEQSSVRRGLSW